MIVLDTNVWSELVRPLPSERVVAWTQRNREDGAITSVTVAELFYGVRLLPAGKRQDALLSRVQRLVDAAGDRLFGFDDAAARTYRELRADADRRGRPMSVEDAMIAAICRTHACPLATRNIKNFRYAGVELIDPWSYEEHEGHGDNRPG
ncbi:type II toxin-antitoxin system VapC family toxin [Sediminivirga luteola]|uniref:Ribonuclease VapC n=1 Tax=Sediminivirga luteola TaxID=1774748 RepID=A0A8J2XKB0_9MICO|nr:type II toxin-antitoxin system VapC family toxin [Sediminivirga luteola]MCI2264882.1 type II toxin-antitoxin system VapC family toxin [Sediminivirga luteola]GGA26577.1 ribonuclease VapC [Sediminivirga luteola]